MKRVLSQGSTDSHRNGLNIDRQLVEYSEFYLTINRRRRREYRRIFVSVTIRRYSRRLRRPIVLV